MEKNERKVSRRKFLLTTGAVTASAVTGLGMLQMIEKTANAANKTTIISGWSQEAVQFNPLLYSQTGTEGMVETCVFDALWDINDKGEYVPNLVTRVPTVENGLITKGGTVWNIELRRGVRWHDGMPFTAKDVEFTYKTVLDPKTRSRTRLGLDKVAKFEVIDDYNIRITLKEFSGLYIWSWEQIHIVPEHLLSMVDDINSCEYNRHPIGTGPFKFGKSVSGSHITYTKNADYHGATSRVDTFIQKFIPDQNVLYSQFKTGEIDILMATGIDPSRIEEARRIPNREIFLCPRNSVEFLYFNCGKPQFKEAVVRKALYLAADKDTWVNDIFYGSVRRSLSYLKPGHWAYNTDLKDIGYNPSKAAEMLDSAGWKIGSDGIRQKEGVKLKFMISTTAGSKAREQSQALLKQNWKAINVEAEIKNFPSSVMWGTFYTNSEFDLALSAHSPKTGVDPDYTARIHSQYIPRKHGKGANYCQYENPKIDRLLEAGLATDDREKRKEIYWKIQEIWYDEVPIAPIFNWSMVFGKKSELKGHSVNPNIPKYGWNVNEWYWA